MSRESKKWHEMIITMIYTCYVCMVSYDKSRQTSFYPLGLIFMYSWQFSSRQDRPQSWYIIALIVVGFLIIYGIWLEVYMMSIVAFLFA
jgi:hypothetical protein